MTVEGQALSVVETLYDAAMDESLWPKALSALADFTGSQSATLWLLDSTDPVPSLPALPWEAQPDGTLRFLSVDQANLVRVSVTPSSSTSISTLFGGN